MEYSACLGRPVRLDSIRHLNDRPQLPHYSPPLATESDAPLPRPWGQWQHLAQHQLKLQKLNKKKKKWQKAQLEADETGATIHATTGERARQN